ncbi:hypothetical protein GQX74_009338 [Glossina fuscipes]|nr:hypothetical protein GQX74_009338 [Glossina fuscipes]
MSLLIKNDNTDNAGICSFHAVNDLGEDASEINLTINDVKCNVSETVRIEVEVNGNSTHIFNLTNNGKDFTEKKNLCNNDNREVIAVVDAEKYRLIFETITCTDGGFYNLTVVSNEPVMISHSMLTKPKFVTPPEDRIVHDYSPSLIKLLVHGMPWLKLEWSKDGRPLDVTTKEKASGEPLHKVHTSPVDSDQKSSEMEVLHIRLSDIGSYAAVATDDVGTTEGPFTLTMQSLAPTFVKSLEPTKEVHQVEPLILECVVNGSPLPLIIWYGDNEEVKPSEQFLITLIHKTFLSINSSALKLPLHRKPRVKKNVGDIVSLVHSENNVVNVVNVVNSGL